MARSDRTTIVVHKAGRLYKICKIWFGSDGSYYVTSPYHKSKKATLVKTTVPYGLGREELVPLSAMLDIASLDDGDQLKLSHHPDGFAQFSGKGVFSGKDSAGNPRGVGVQARALSHVAPGPTFILTVNAVERFDSFEDGDSTALIFDYDKLLPIPGQYGFRLEGHYVQPEYRRFVQAASDGTQWIQMIHPSRAILKLRALPAPLDCELPAVVAFDFFASPSSDEHADFVLSGPGGNLRDDPHGRNVADQISAIYPPPAGMPIFRSVDYPQRDGGATAEGGG